MGIIKQTFLNDNILQIRIIVYICPPVSLLDVVVILVT